MAVPKTIRCFALQLNPSSFGIFNTFEDKAGREAHLSGEIAHALMAMASELLVSNPVVEQIELLAKVSIAT